jgi:hypothetical protein
MTTKNVEIEEAPAAFRQALRKGAPVFTDHDGRMTELLSNAPLGLPLVTASLDEVNSRIPLVEHESNLWRFMARDPAGLVVFGEVSSSKGRPKLVRVSKDPRALVAFDATMGINERSEVQNDIYKLRLLRIAGVLVEALWLHSKTGKQDWFFPVLSASNDLRINHAYSPDEFFARVRALGQRFRNFDKTRMDAPPSNA